MTTAAFSIGKAIATAFLEVCVSKILPGTPLGAVRAWKAERIGGSLHIWLTLPIILNIVRSTPKSWFLIRIGNLIEEVAT